MIDDTEADGLRERLTKQGESTLGRLAEDLLANPVVSGAIATAFDARERATAAQEAAFSAMNIPSASDIERLTRRVRSVSQRLEGIEDGIDRLDERLAGAGANPGLDARLDSIDAQLKTLTAEIAKVLESVPAEIAKLRESVPVEIAKLRESLPAEGAAEPAAKPAAKSAAKPAGKPEGKPAAKPAGKPAGKPAAKPAARRQTRARAAG